MRRLIALSVFWIVTVLPGLAVIREVPAGQSPLPPAVLKERRTAEEVMAAFVKDREGAALAYGGKPFRLTGRVVGFDVDYPLNYEHDVFFVVGPSAASDKDFYPIYVRFSRPQFKVFGYPQDRKPKIDRYPDHTRAVNQAHTVAYFDRDLNGIALYDSETLTPPLPTVRGTKAAPPFPVVFEKIPLVSVGDPFDADVQFDELDGNGTLIFHATIDPTPPPVPRPTS